MAKKLTKAQQKRLVMDGYKKFVKLYANQYVGYMGVNAIISPNDMAKIDNLMKKMLKKIDSNPR